MDNKMASFGGRREFQRKSLWKFFLFLIFLTAFLVSGGLLLRNLYRSQQEQGEHKEQQTGDNRRIDQVVGLYGKNHHRRNAHNDVLPQEGDQGQPDG